YSSRRLATNEGFLGENRVGWVLTIVGSLGSLVTGLQFGGTDYSAWGCSPPLTWPWPQPAPWWPACGYSTGPRERRLRGARKVGDTAAHSVRCIHQLDQLRLDCG